MTVDDIHAALIRAHEHELSAIYDSVPGILFYIAVEPDGEFRFLSVSRDFLSATGLNREQVVGSLVRDVIPSPSREMVLNYYREAIRSGQPVRWEEQSVYPAGQRYGEVAVMPLYDANGVATHLIGIVHDITQTVVTEITERKRAEETLSRLAAIVESSEDAIISKNLEGIITSWNAGAERLFGYKETEVIGHPITILFPPELLEDENRILEALRAGGHVERYDTVRVTKAGKKTHVWVSSSPIRDSTGKINGFSKIARDITERKRAEETLRESEEKFRCVFRDAGVGTVIVSPEGRFLEANSAFCECLGYTEEELLEKTVESITFPEDWHAFSQRLAETLKEGRGLQWFEKRCLHKSGRIIYTESSASVIRSREGVPLYLVGHVLDVTERKEAEEALAEMTRKLIEAQEQERARIGRELHDDINQRLAMLEVELEQPQDPSEFQKRVQRFRVELRQISDDVQALSHDLHSTKLEYLGVVAGMKSWCKEFAERQKMDVDFKSDVRSVLPLDIGRPLFRVLQEALHNSFKHSGVKRIEVRLREDSGEIHLIIIDSGKGFDIEAALQGKGLGLTSIRERVRLVNGTITIDSKPMGGTTIHVRVPLEADQAQRAAG